jgi:hypothetical protein
MKSQNTNHKSETGPFGPVWISDLSLSSSVASAEDPLAEVRAAVARATNVEYALVANHVCSLATPRVLPRDCAGMAG